MKTVCKKLFSLMLVAVLLLSAIPFQAFAAETVTVYFRFDQENTSFTKVENFELGKALGTKMPTSATVTSNYNAKYSDGKVFTGTWVLADGPKKDTAITKDTVLSADMRNDDGHIILRAVFEYPEMTVTLNANGGKVSPSSVSYQMHETIASKLPAPTRDGYVFAGWFTNVNDESTRVTSETIVTKSMTLYAKWTVGSLPVVFQGWDADNNTWVEVERRSPTTGKSLADSNQSMPTADSRYGVPRAGYSVDETNPWVDSNGKVFTKDTVVNAVTYVRPNFVANTYTITYNYNCEELANDTQKVKFGSTVTLKQPTRANYVFRGWIIEGVDKELKTGDTYNYGDITLMAKWAPKGTVELRVYRDDQSGFKTYYYSGAVLGNELDLNDCNIRNYLSGTYEFDGWYDYNGWISYLGTKSAAGVEYASNAITRVEKVTTSNTTNSTITVLYGMVKGYEASTESSGSTSNNNTNDATRDPSNPATGDHIMIAVTTMALAAAALVTMVELKKRKMI